MTGADWALAALICLWWVGAWLATFHQSRQSRRERRW